MNNKREGGDSSIYGNSLGGDTQKSQRAHSHTLHFSRLSVSDRSKENAESDTCQEVKNEKRRQQLNTEKRRKTTTLL